MGRTILPFSQVLSEKQSHFSKFRRALRQEDQQAFDALFEQARIHIQAAVYYADPDPAEALFLSMMIEHWKLIDQMEKRIAELEAQVQTITNQNGNTAA
jgi:hypothetical protein